MALFFLNYRVASANNLFCFIELNYLFGSGMAFVEVFPLVLACSFLEEVVLGAVSQLLKVEITWVQVATDLKFWV
jgi:hypothetical protein